MDREKWIGLAEVRPTPACRELKRPAFVNVIGLALDRNAFVDLIRSACNTIGVRLLRVDDIELWRDRLANWEPDEEIRESAELVSDENQFVFGTFVCFPEE